MKAVSDRKKQERRKEITMKSMIQISRNLSLALVIAGLLATSAAFAQQKGAEKQIQLKPAAAAGPADVSIPATMNCPKCKDATAAVAELTFKGATHGQLKTVAVHQCPACADKIATQGHGKDAKDVVAHTCSMNGSQASGCCATK